MKKGKLYMCIAWYPGLTVGHVYQCFKDDTIYTDCGTEMTVDFYGHHHGVFTETKQKYAENL